VTGTLEFEADDQPKRVLYCWLLPLLWGAGCWFGWQYPGDEHLLWLMGSMAGAWIAVLDPGIGEHAGIMPVVLLTGCVVMLLVGGVMDVLRVSFLWFLLVFLLFAAAVAGFTISRFPSYQAALVKNETLQAYLLFGGMIGLYLAVVLTVPLRIFSLLISSWRNRSSRQESQEWQWRTPEG
jgi:hypothetical protein